MRRRCGIVPHQLFGVGAHVLPDQRARHTQPVVVVEAEAKREVSANSEEVK